MSRGNHLLVLLSSLFTFLILYALGQSIIPVQAALSSLDQAQTCTPGMLSFWPLDDGPDATLFADVVGGNDGTCTGVNCPTSSAGKIDSAFTFDRSHPDKVNARADNPSLNWAGTESFSFELWVNRAESCGQREVFIGKYKDKNEGPSWASWWVGCGNNKAVFSLRDSIQNTLTITSTVSVTDGVWHHIVAGRDGAANLLYVDAVLQDSVPYTYTGNFTSNNGFTMGYHNVSPYYYFSGQLDEVAVYGRMLTAEEVGVHYNNGVGQPYCIGPPTAIDDSFDGVEEDSSPAPLDVLPNDTVAPDSSGSPVIIAVGPGSAGGTTSTDGSFVYYAPAANFFGEETFTYTINDTYEGNNATATVTVDVSPVNDPPTANDDSFTVEENSTDVPLDVLANDTIAPDIGETLTIVNLGAASQGGSLTTDGSLISYTPPFDFVGTETFTYTINDGTPASDDSATVTILVTPENKPPEVDNPGDQVNTEGDDVSLQIVASDPENADLTFGATGLPSGLSMDPAAGLISGVVGFDAAPGSPHTVVVSASDNGVPALVGSATFSWNIIENSGPNLLDPGDQSNLVGDEVFLQIVAGDADGDTLTYAASGLAPGLTIHSETGLINGVLPANSSGNWTVEIAVSDGDNDKDASAAFSWNIKSLVFLPLIIGN